MTQSNAGGAAARQGKQYDPAALACELRASKRATQEAAVATPRKPVSERDAAAIRARVTLGREPSDDEVDAELEAWRREAEADEARRQRVAEETRFVPGYGAGPPKRGAHVAAIKRPAAKRRKPKPVTPEIDPDTGQLERLFLMLEPVHLAWLCERTGPRYGVAPLVYLTAGIHMERSGSQRGVCRQTAKWLGEQIGHGEKVTQDAIAKLIKTGCVERYGKSWIRLLGPLPEARRVQ